MPNKSTCVIGVHKWFISLGIGPWLVHTFCNNLVFVCKKTPFMHHFLHKFSTQFSTSTNRILHLLAGRFYTVYTAPIISTSWVKKSIHYLVGFSLEGGLS